MPSQWATWLHVIDSIPKLWQTLCMKIPGKLLNFRDDKKCGKFKHIEIHYPELCFASLCWRILDVNSYNAPEIYVEYSILICKCNFCPKHSCIIQFYNNWWCHICTILFTQFSCSIFWKKFYFSYNTEISF